MFYALHRTMKFLLLCAFVGAGWRVYENRQVFEPALIWYDVWDNGGLNEKDTMPSVSGEVEQILNSQTFVLRSTNAMRFNVRLLGLKDPPKAASFEGLKKETERKERLEELIKG